MLGCLGDSWFGKDVDRICSYNTPKIVKFRHRELGCMARTLKLLIGIYVFLFLIWYKGKHFKVYPITGMNRLTFQMPTRNMCNPKLKNCLTNFTRYSDLPYCSMTGEKSVSQLPCRAYDSIGLAVPYVEGVVLPTRIRAYSQQRAECSEEQESMGACKRLWEYLDDSGNEQSETKRQPLDEYFVANIEDYTMQIDHSFATPEIGQGYDDYKMQGYWMDCEHTGKHGLTTKNCKRRPIVCMRKNCKPWMVVGEGFEKQAAQTFLASSASVLTADDDEESQFADFANEDDDTYEFQHEIEANGDSHVWRSNLQHSNSHPAHLLNGKQHHKHLHHVIDEIRYPEMALLQSRANPSVDNPFISAQNGDVLTVGHLVQMAGISLDDKHFGKPFRRRGLVLEVSITYSNAKPWQLWQAIDPPEYTIEVTRRPAFEFQLDHLVDTFSLTHRDLLSYHGIYIKVQQNGEMRQFSFLTILQILAGALSLLKGASMATDYAACNLIAAKDEVKSLKYEESRDFYPDREPYGN